MTTPGDASVELPKARFISDTLLFVSRDAPIIYDLTSRTETPAPPSSARVLDPSGALLVAGLERRCAGVTVRIERATRDADSPDGRIGSALVLSHTLGPDCVDTPQSVQRDNAGFRVLGWAPQGLLLARGAEVRLVPLGLDGRATGEPRALENETPRPAPLPLGRATADGSRYAWLSPFGVVVFAAQGAPPELFRPEGWDAIAGGASDVAISPSGQRLAVLSGGQCHIIAKEP